MEVAAVCSLDSQKTHSKFIEKFKSSPRNQSKIHLEIQSSISKEDQYQYL